MDALGTDRRSHRAGESTDVSWLMVAAFWRRLVIGRQVRPIERWVAQCDSLLDVGCGADSPLQYISFSGTTIGVDGFPPALEAAMARSTHGEYLERDILHLDLPKNSADAVVALEVLEHLPKEDGAIFLSVLENIAREVVVISTPNGYVEQGASDGNEYQRHLSGWNAAELRALGYQVYGTLGLKRLRGSYAAISYRPRWLWAMLSRLSEWYVWQRPEKAFGLLCYKKVWR